MSRDDCEKRLRDLWRQYDSFRERAAVLVVIHPDGYVEAFSKADNVMVVSLYGDGIRDEDQLEATLPDRYKRVYFPGYMKANGLPREIDELDRLNSATAAVLAEAVKQSCQPLKKGKVDETPHSGGCPRGTVGQSSAGPVG